MESPVVTATAGLLRFRVHTEVHTCCGQVGLRLLQEPRSTDAEGGEYAYHLAENFDGRLNCNIDF